MHKTIRRKDGQMEPYQIKKLLHIKGNSHQTEEAEETAYTIGENFHQLYI
jgi:hypothetical protein